MNLSIIHKFIEDQSKVNDILCDRLQVPRGVKAHDWAMESGSYRNAYEKSHFARKFYIHGFGIEYEDENIYIDYDYGQTVSLGGFDEWRIYIYLTAGDPNKWDKNRSLQKSIYTWLEELSEGKVIKRLDSLYYFAS